MQIENSETSLTPPTPSSPGRDAQSPEGIASLSSGSSDNALGKYNLITIFPYFFSILCAMDRDSKAIHIKNFLLLIFIFIAFHFKSYLHLPNTHTSRNDLVGKIYD